MTLIRVLPDHTINQIAAGEVIENPASVVKELVENSLDAKSTRIVIEISSAGHQLIRVSDNGTGMGPDDAVLCLERHATSKIASFDDLFALQSMGFRGEAMASIAGVSKLILVSALDSKVGTCVEVEGGKLMKVLPAPRQRGTTVEVRSLFYNVPVRKKFQKNAAASTMEIHRIVLALSLAHPLVEFELKQKDDVLFATGPSIKSDFAEGLQNRIRAVLGDEFKEISHEVAFHEGDYQFQGLIGSPQHTRLHRTGQYLFINRRAVFAPFVSYTVRDAYGTRIDAGRHPIYVIHMTLPPHLVDVNVHPQKKEVRFKEEISLKQMISRAVGVALGDKESSPHMFFEAIKTEGIPYQRQENFSLTFSDERPREPLLPFPKALEAIGVFEEYLFIKASSLLEKDLFQDKKMKEGDLVIVDLVAAQEVLFTSKFLEGKRQTQHLLFPLKISFSPLDAELIENNRQVFIDLGIVLGLIAKNTFAIEAVPDMISFDDAAKVLHEIVDGIRALEIQDTMDEEQKMFFAKKICQFATAKKPPFMLQEGVTIVEKLLRCETPFFTLQGKPTMTCVDIEDVRELFKTRKNKVL